jgi:hypothetical protein
MKKTTNKPRRLVLDSEHLRLLAGGGSAQPQDMTSQLSNRSSCQGTQFCCKPPFA